MHHCPELGAARGISEVSSNEATHWAECCRATWSFRINSLGSASLACLYAASARLGHNCWCRPSGCDLIKTANRGLVHLCKCRTRTRCYGDPAPLTACPHDRGHLGVADWRDIKVLWAVVRALCKKDLSTAATCGDHLKYACRHVCKLCSQVSWARTFDDSLCRQSSLSRFSAKGPM